MDDQPTENNKKSAPLTFTSEDTKLLVITFLGTVAANLVTVIFVGLAIAIAHFLRPGHGGVPYILLIAVTLAAVIYVPIGLRTMRKATRIVGLSVSTKRFAIGSVTIMILIASMFVLVWVGIAAGIK